MSTQNKNTAISGINHRVRSGGLYWKQVNIGKGHYGANRQGVWYFTSEAKLAEADMPRWLISNRNLATLLCVSSNSLARYANFAYAKHTVYHDDAPTHFVSEDIKHTKRTRQLLWTLDGVHFIFNKSGIRLNANVKKEMELWIAGQAAVSGHRNTETPDIVVPNSTEEDFASAIDIKSVQAAKHTIIEAVKYVTDIVDQLWFERNKRRELEVEVSSLRDQIERFSSPRAAGASRAEVNVKSLKSVKAAVAAKQNILVDLSSAESLSQYLSRNGKKQYKAEQLTRMGLLNSDQIYSLFSDSWLDKSTSELIQKDKFQDLLRQIFHLKHSSHRTPMLKAEMIRDNMAVVCQVFCKKKPNPTDDYGNKLELDNPAYTSNSDPCVRFQVRYTAKAIDYLRNNWYMLLDSVSEQKVTV
jgi:hypothetical protein